MSSERTSPAVQQFATERPIRYDLNGNLPFGDSFFSTTSLYKQKPEQTFMPTGLSEKFKDFFLDALSNSGLEPLVQEPGDEILKNDLVLFVTEDYTLEEIAEEQGRPFEDVNYNVRVGLQRLWGELPPELQEKHKLKNIWKLKQGLEDTPRIVRDFGWEPDQETINHSVNLVNQLRNVLGNIRTLRKINQQRSAYDQLSINGRSMADLLREKQFLTLQALRGRKNGNFIHPIELRLLAGEEEEINENSINTVQVDIRDNDSKNNVATRITLGELRAAGKLSTAEVLELLSPYEKITPNQSEFIAITLNELGALTSRARKLRDSGENEKAEEIETLIDEIIISRLIKIKANKEKLPDGTSIKVSAIGDKVIIDAAVTNKQSTVRQTYHIANQDSASYTEIRNEKLEKYLRRIGVNLDHASKRHHQEEKAEEPILPALPPTIPEPEPEPMPEEIIRFDNGVYDMSKDERDKDPRVGALFNWYFIEAGIPEDIKAFYRKRRYLEVEEWKGIIARINKKHPYITFAEGQICYVDERGQRTIMTPDVIKQFYGDSSLGTSIGRDRDNIVHFGKIRFRKLQEDILRVAERAGYAPPIEDAA